MTVYPYAVLVEVRGLGHVSVFADMEVNAYSIHDAMMQAVLEIEGRHSFIERGFSLKVVSVVPAEYAKTLDGIKARLQLLRAPAIGSTA